ncbi:hypothetical protein [Candidatus Lokiarchaeum ossiferum]|uniref:hypothetical protein n=1 Tax=Candidatus Lokiarchaeum ossiferum TaxID=2951803 RepID=UPI00352D4656
MVAMTILQSRRTNLTPSQIILGHFSGVLEAGRFSIAVFGILRYFFGPKISVGPLRIHFSVNKP